MRSRPDREAAGVTTAPGPRRTTGRVRAVVDPAGAIAVEETRTARPTGTPIQRARRSISTSPGGLSISARAPTMDDAATDVPDSGPRRGASDRPGRKQDLREAEKNSGKTGYRRVRRAGMSVAR